MQSYESYEITHCISYEMAIRNKDVKILLKNIKILTILSKKLYEYYINFGDVRIEENPYFELKNIVEEALELLSHHKSSYSINIKLNGFKLLETQASVMQIITHLMVILEENYYMLYDRKEIVPQGMEDVFKEPNHHEPDSELNHFMDKVIEQSIYSSDDPDYKDNYTKEDGYIVYQGGYDKSASYDINKIKPNFKRPMREFNQTQVAFNMSLPREEIIKYIEKIKDDYDDKNTSYKTLNELLYGDETRIEDTLNHKDKERYADDFFIYDYYIQSDEGHERKLEIIQKKLSQYHGMKIEIGRNDYEYIDYDEVQNKKDNNLSSTQQIFPSSLDELKMSFKKNKHTIHHLAIDIIEKRFNQIKKSIDGKKYKALIHHG